MLSAMHTAPPVLVHGDAHYGNTFVLPAGAVGLCDWQAVAAAPWSHDVVYFVTAALSIEDRRKSERDLLAGYVGRLRALGVEPPDPDTMWMSYRKAAMYGFYVWLVNPAEWQPEHVNTAATRRFAAALEDLDVFAALGV
jgi:aminoglycoside phosphotransferase (APT) family kinase protein